MNKSKKFEGEGYILNISSKNIALSPSMENYILKKLSKVDRIANHILDIEVMVDLQKVTHIVSIVMKFFHFRIKVQAMTEDMYSAIDKAFERLYKLINKYKTKLQHHRVKEPPNAPMLVRVLEPLGDLEDINDQIEEENLKEDEELYKIREVVAEETIPLRILTREEAMMRFELSGDNFLIYRSEEDQKLKVMFRRKDQKIGMIQVE